MDNDQVESEEKLTTRKIPCLAYDEKFNRFRLIMKRGPDGKQVATLDDNKCRDWEILAF